MENQITKISLLFSLFLFGHSAMFSQDYLMDTVEVTTTRLPLKIGETGRNISVLQGDQLQQLPFTSLDELLQYIPGIEVQSRNAFGAQGDISMRGATFTQVLLLVDGMKLNDPLTGHFNSYIPVTPSEIERIEVLRGAAAAMYGADAVGGVINIITKANLPSGQDKTQVQGAVNYGEHSLVNVQQGFSVSKDKLYVGGGFAMNKSDGEHLPGKEVEGTALNGYDNYFDIKTIGTSIGYRFNNNWSATARTAYDDRDFSARYFYTNSTFDKSVEKTKSWWNQARLTKTGDRSSTDFNLAYKRSTDEFVFSPDFPSTNNHTMQFLNFQANHLFVANDFLSVKMGLQADRRSIESNDRGNHEDLHGGLYAMGILRPATHLNLTGSLRFDHDQNYGTEISPQVNVSYVLPSVTLRASAGRSIRAADYTERYVSTNLQNLTPGRSLGNPALKAEDSWSEEIGFDYFINQNWKIKATGFIRQSTNLIDYVRTNAADIAQNTNLQEGADYFLATNVTDVETNGFEVESWYQQRLTNSSNLRVSMGYTYLNTTNKEEVISVYISSHAGHLFNSNLVFKTNKFEVGLNGLYKVRDARVATAIGADLKDSYTLWNLKLGVNLTENFGLNLQAHNLLDENYQDILGAQMPGRWLMGGIKFGF